MPGYTDNETRYRKDIESIEKGYTLHRNRDRSLRTNFDVVISRAYNIIQLSVRRPEIDEEYFSLVEEAEIGNSDFFTQTGDKSAVHTVLSYKTQLKHAIDYAKNLINLPIYHPASYNNFATLLSVNKKAVRFTRIPRTYFYYCAYKGNMIIVPFNFLRFWIYPAQTPTRAGAILGFDPLKYRAKFEVTMTDKHHFDTLPALKKRRNKIKVGDIVICNKPFYPGIKKNEDTFKVMDLGKYDKDYYIADIKNKKGVVFTVKLTHLKKYNKV